MTKYQYPYNRLCTGLVLLLCLLTAIGCSHKKTIRPQPRFSKWRALAEDSKGYSPSSRRRNVDLPRENEKMTPGKEKKQFQAIKLPKRKISLRLKDTEISTMLRAMTRSVGINILINEKIKGKITINVKNAEWGQLFKGILRSYGLTYEWDGNLIRVMTMSDMEQDLKEATQKRDLRFTRAFVTKIMPVDFADAKKLKANLEKFLSKNQKGKAMGSVMVDEHTKSLIIQALPEDADRLSAMVKELDRPTAQVLIEAQIVEANKDTARQLGIQWGGLAKSTGNVNQFLTAGANSTGTLGSSLTSAVDPKSGMAVNFPANLEGGTGLTLGYMAQNVGDNILAVQLSALQKDGVLNILSSPSITTLDNQSAIIESGTNVPYQTTSADGNINIKWKDAVLRLEVEPHVIDDKTIKLSIKTKKDELDFSRSINGNPTIITKKAETGVILEDGQTTVIGGLNKETNTSSLSGVPWLKDIPYLGFLFRGSSDSNTKEDVLIFITPHILKKKQRIAAEPSIPDIHEKVKTGAKDNKKQHMAKFTSNDGNNETILPPSMGVVTMKKNETLWNMIRIIYGDYKPGLVKAIVRMNPGLTDPGNISTGRVIYFPTRIVKPEFPERNSFWVKIGEKKNLEEAYEFVNSFPDGSGIRMIPLWAMEKGLRFDLVVGEYFYSKQKALDRIKNLPESIRGKAEVFSDWGEDVVFFSDPFSFYR